jgi:ketosteroid isomerase-like protein
MRRAIVFATAEAAEEAFYDAMQRGDLAAMMALWGDDDDVVCVHPNGQRLVGMPAIRESFAAIFAHGGLDVRRADLHVHQGTMLSVHNLIEKIVVRQGNGTRLAECVATNAFIKTSAGWRIVLHQSAQAASEPASPHEVPDEPPGTLH